MTSLPAAPAEGTPTEDPTRRTGGSGRRRRALVGALLGAVVLGAGGALLAASAEPEVNAAALVQTYPDPAGVENPTTGTLDGDQAARNATYLETELVTLNSADLAAAVATTLGDAQDDVRLESVRSGDSNVITITGTSTDAQDAVAQAQTAAETYISGRQQRLADRITGLLATVETQISTNQQALDALPTPPTNGVDVNQQQRAALSQQNIDLLSARDTLQRAAADTGQVAGVIQQAAVLPSGSLSSGVLTVAAAILVGALLGGVLAPVVSSLRGRVRDSHDVSGLGVPVISPDLPAAASRRRAGVLRRVVQLQALQLPEGPVNGGSLAVVAPGPGVGTTFVALAHARHAALRRPTLLVSYDLDEIAALLGGLHEPSLVVLGTGGGSGHSAPDAQRSEVLVRRAVGAPGLAVLALQTGTGLADVVPSGLADAAAGAGWAVVVDAPPLDRSDEGLLAARQCRETILVAATGPSRIADVDRAVQILHGAGATPAGIVVNKAPRHRRRRKPTAATPAASAQEPEPTTGPEAVAEPTDGTDRMPAITAERTDLPTTTRG
ncbi:hypothetical protein [Klenkia terrae]|uniref:P-loop containing nucleoside triphosphate hydrolase n=1 Tax=Klenkia terrae TaxID=1052259 RepID=A0ABU8E3T8_9ACTN|nr:hypothetical protein [Klenkia terrae]